MANRAGSRDVAALTINWAGGAAGWPPTLRRVRSQRPGPTGDRAAGCPGGPYPGLGSD